MVTAPLQKHRRHATTASGAISYLDVGRGRTAVFIHGLMTNTLLWRHVIAATASDRRRCVAVDLPGHGHTPPAAADADVTLTGLAQRVIELIDHLGVQRVDLVANDTGGAVAQIVAARLGDRLATLTLTDCDTEGNTPPWPFAPVTAVARVGLLPAIGLYLAARRWLLRAVLAIGYRHPRELSDDIIDAYGRPVLGTAESSRALARIIMALSSDDLAAIRPELTALQAPTLIVWGTSDFFRAKWAHRLAALIPATVAIEWIEGARMHFPDERAHHFCDLLCGHWAAHDG
ncbi:alpha/beta fold hydrolase [Mycolicibacterium sp. S2-37]|uniref:alpha/beta fold hydrolase n=1 Tax=Mycolicibacterium sp. S2-37 TaxID=2810297 RepID=UPI001A948AB4|nr:alpha/beta fold hydrolase [Mycolicibacterium sp. S2-37]MBO0678822.1 alpha/beta fold hydrolase [Mycolicibacterium sp. S2-37]